MNRLLVALLFAGCGVPDDAPFIAPSSSAITTTTYGDEPISCVAICERVRPQLERDFAVLPSSINCPQQMANADTCDACNERFERLFGVRLLSC